MVAAHSPYAFALSLRRLLREAHCFIRIPLISSFKAYFKVDLTIAERENVSDYTSFNDFFTRALKPGLRIPSGTLSAPADGMVSAAGQVEQGVMLQAKGQSFEIAELLGDANHPFQAGSYITTYLSPRDYHRVHFPCDARLETSTYVPGALFSVNAQTSQHIPRLFARNERLVMSLACEQGHRYGAGRRRDRCGDSTLLAGPSANGQAI